MRYSHLFALFVILIILLPASLSQLTEAKNETLANKPSIIWARNVGTVSTDAYFKVYENYVVYGDFGVRIFRADNGVEVWHNDTFFLVGVRNNSIYAIKNAMEENSILCLGFDGKIKWNVSLDFVIGGIIFIPSGIIVYSYFSPPLILALISYNGDVLMHREWKTLGLERESDYSCFISVSNNIIYFIAHDKPNKKTYLYAVNTSGYVLWNITTSDLERSYLFAYFTVDKNGTNYVLFGGGWNDWGKYSIYAINKGQILWKVDGDASKVNPGIAFLRLNNKFLYHIEAGNNIYLQKINITDGRIIHTTIINRFFSYRGGYWIWIHPAISML